MLKMQPSIIGRATGRGQGASGEEGFALILAVITAILLTLIGLSLTSSSLVEFSMSNEFEAHEKALVVADAAFNRAKNSLRGKDLTTVLSTPTPVPKYINYTEPQPGTHAARNPLFPHEARNVDFDYPPNPVGMRNAFGFLTPPPPYGVQVGSGRFFASISDNEDELPLGLANDPQTDTDYTVYLRVLAVEPATGAEVNTVGSGRKNSMAILEGLLRRDLSFDLASPMIFYGPDVNATFSGNSFDIIGDPNHSAIGVMNDDPGGGDADEAYQSILDAIGNKGNVVGEPGPDGKSLQDVTPEVRASGNPDATNVFSPAFLINLIRLLSAYADVVYPDGTHLSGGGVQLGTPANPQITVASGDFELSGGGSGAGVLLVTGSFEYGGSFDFDGLVLVVGEGHLNMHGANKTITGGAYIARIEEDAQGNPQFGIPTIDLSGNSNFVFDSGNLMMAINLLPFKVLSMREITPEIEPSP